MPTVGPGHRWPTCPGVIVGVRAGSLILNLPGSPNGAMESLEAIIPILDHALETLAGPYDHARGTETQGG